MATCSGGVCTADNDSELQTFVNLQALLNSALPYGVAPIAEDGQIGPDTVSAAVAVFEQLHAESLETPDMIVVVGRPDASTLAGLASKLVTQLSSPSVLGNAALASAPQVIPDATTGQTPVARGGGGHGWLWLVGGVAAVAVLAKLA